MAPEITAAELAVWRAEGRAFVLLDVRDADELQMAKLDGAMHIPMREIPARAAELDEAADIAVLCHHGGRSAQVAAFLQARGFARVVNVDGGIDAYAREVDRSIPRY